jgi:hypothetical protein
MVLEYRMKGFLLILLSIAIYIVIFIVVLGILNVAGIPIG